jgi:hypothetical protein
MLSEEELTLLDAIRETGILSRAATRLGKAPSTISHAARQVETRFVLSAQTDCCFISMAASFTRSTQTLFAGHVRQTDRDRIDRHTSS